MLTYVKLLSILFLILAGSIIAQDLDISEQLNDIDAGKVTKVKKDLSELKQKYPNNPSVIYLDALLTEDGKEAVRKYSAVVDNYPKSKYADAALYRIYTYYYAIGSYRMADGYLQQLKDTYPQSEYIKMAEDIAEGKDPATVQKPADKKNIAVKAVPSPAQAPVKATPVKVEVKPKVSKFTIQAGAFISLNNARNLKKAFEDAGYFSEIKEKTIAGSVLNVVTIGKYATESEARAELSVINKNFNLEGRVVPLN